MSVRGNTAGEYFGEWFGPVEVVPGAMSASIGGSGGITATLTAISETPQETGKGWPKNRRQRRAAKRLEASIEPVVNRDLISADVARALQAKRLKPVEAPKTEAKADVSPEPEAPAVGVSDESVRAILEAWARIEARQAQEAQQMAQAEIARIQALREEELMIVTMIAALA